MQYIQDITRLIYEYNLEIERFLTKNKSGSVGFTPPHYHWSITLYFFGVDEVFGPTAPAEMRDELNSYSALHYQSRFAACKKGKFSPWTISFQKKKHGSSLSEVEEGPLCSKRARTVRWEMLMYSIDCRLPINLDGFNVNVVKIYVVVRSFSRGAWHENLNIGVING